MLSDPRFQPLLWWIYGLSDPRFQKLLWMICGLSCILMYGLMHRRVLFLTVTVAIACPLPRATIFFVF